MFACLYFIPSYHERLSRLNKAMDRLSLKEVFIIFTLLQIAFCLLSFPLFCLFVTILHSRDLYNVQCRRLLLNLRSLSLSLSLSLSYTHGTKAHSFCLSFHTLNSLSLSRARARAHTHKPHTHTRTHARTHARTHTHTGRLSTVYGKALLLSLIHI